MPVVAQVTAAVALTALIMGPWWMRVDARPVATPTPLPTPPPAAVAPPAAIAMRAPQTSTVPLRSAHLNLDVRHTFSKIDLLVTVDGKRVIQTKLEGSGKKFKMFGKRSERGYTRTLDLEPGVRLVRINVKADGGFDQTRVERFDLESASVASLRITADKDEGLLAAADRPPVAEKVVERIPEKIVGKPAPLPASAPPPVEPQVQAVVQQADSLSRLLNSLRSILIAIAGFVATTSAGFVLEQYLGAKKRAFVDARRSSSNITPTT